MKTLREKDLIPNLICEFEASGKTNASVQVKFATHFDKIHAVQRARLSSVEILSIDKRAFDLLSLQPLA